jgi:MFS family permease
MATMTLASTTMASKKLSDPASMDVKPGDRDDVPLTGMSSAGNQVGALLDDQAPENAVEATPDGGYGWTVVASCAWVLFWINGYTTTWGVLQTALLESSTLTVDVQTVTFIGSLYMGLMVAFSLASVRLMSRYGTQYSSVAAMTLFGLAPILTSFTLDNIGGLFVTAGALLGLASSLAYTATNTLPVQWFSSKLGTANGLVKAGGGLGATVFPLAAQALIDSVGLAWTFRIIGILMLATGVPAAWLMQDRAQRGRVARYDWSQLKNPPFLALAIAGAIGVFALFVPPFFLPLFAKSIGLTASTGAGLVAGFGGSTAIGRLVSGWICDRIGAFNTLTITLLINSLSMFAIWPVSSSLPPLLIFAVVNGLANGSFFVALPTAVASLAPGSAAASISLATSFWTPGYLLGSPIAGILIQRTGAAEASSIEPYLAAIFYAAGTGVVAMALVTYSRLKLDRKLLKKL